MKHQVEYEDHLNKAWDGFGPMNPYGSFVPEI